MTREAVRRGAVRRWLAVGGLCGLTAACAVGPDFAKPKAPAGDYGRMPAQTVSVDAPAGASQRFVRDLDVPAQWWTLYRSPALDALVARAIEANPSIQAAQAALRVAVETAYAQAGTLLPTVAGSYAPTRAKTSSALAPTPANNSNIYSLYTAQLSLAYSPDVFGLNRRTLESLQAQAENQLYTLEATYLSLTANVVTAAIQEASLRGQIAATREIITIQRELLGLLRKQNELGAAAGLDVAAQEAALASAEATLPPLTKQLQQQRTLLTALVGAFPSGEPAEIFELASFELPAELPVSLPSKLVEQRPDVRAAEALLHAASAQIGVAVANRLPNFTLSAAWGTAALRNDGLFGPGAGFWSLGASLTQPIFDGFSLLHRERAARAAYDQAAAQYRSIVIGALQSVADALRGLETDADALRAAVAAERAARTQLDITRRQMELGQISYLAQLNAQQAYLTAVVVRVQAQANRLSDTAGLFQALGGGWWNRPERERPIPAELVAAAEESPWKALGNAIWPWR